MNGVGCAGHESVLNRVLFYATYNTCDEVEKTAVLRLVTRDRWVLTKLFCNVYIPIQLRLNRTRKDLCANSATQPYAGTGICQEIRPVFSSAPTHMEWTNSRQVESALHSIGTAQRVLFIFVLRAILRVAVHFRLTIQPFRTGHTDPRHRMRHRNYKESSVLVVGNEYGNTRRCQYYQTTQRDIMQGGGSNPSRTVHPVAHMERKTRMRGWPSLSALPARHARFSFAHRSYYDSRTEAIFAVANQSRPSRWGPVSYPVLMAHCLRHWISKSCASSPRQPVVCGFSDLAICSWPRATPLHRKRSVAQVTLQSLFRQAQEGHWRDVWNYTRE